LSWCTTGVASFADGARFESLCGNTTIVLDAPDVVEQPIEAVLRKHL
jgi:hypothetical protein